MTIVVATPRPAALGSFLMALGADGAEVVTAPDAGTALKTAAERRPALVVVDEGLPDAEPDEVVRRLLRVNALINAAVVTRLGTEEFHEKTEGLGILAGLPVALGEPEARELLTTLGRIA